MGQGHKGSVHGLGRCVAITARAVRNNNLYFSQPNVIELMRFVKAYVKSLGQPAKPYYEALVNLKFRMIKS